MSSEYIYKILLNLRIMSKIPINSKIYMNSWGEIVIDSNSTYNSLKRFFLSYDRKYMVEKLSMIVECAITESLRSEHDNKEIAKVINMELNESIFGLNNLIKTYDDDLTTVSYLEIMTERINRFLLNAGFEKKEINHVQQTIEQPILIPECSWKEAIEDDDNDNLFD